MRSAIRALCGESNRIRRWGQKEKHPLSDCLIEQADLKTSLTDPDISDLSSIFQNENEKKSKERIIRNRLYNPNHTAIRTCDLLATLFFASSFIAYQTAGFSQLFLLPVVFGSGFFLTRMILWFTGRTLMQKAESLINGNGLISSWILDQAALKKYAASESKRQTAQVRTALYASFFAASLTALIAFVPLPIWGGVMIALGVGLFTLLISFFNGWTTSRLIMESDGSVYIGNDGVVIAGVYHEWHSMGRKLATAEYDEKTGTILCGISTRQLSDKIERTIAIPVPHDRQHEVEGILRKFAEAYQNT